MNPGGKLPGIFYAENQPKSGRKMNVLFIFCPLFLCKNLTMNRYMERLKDLGYSPDEARNIYFYFLRNFGRLALIEYIEQMERDEKCG